MTENEKPVIEIVGHSMMHDDGKHEVLNLEQTKYIPDDEGIGVLFETWCCMHKKCNYLEYRLKEGHREDR